MVGEDAEFVGDVGRQVEYGTFGRRALFGQRPVLTGRVGRREDASREFFVGVGRLVFCFAVGLADGVEGFARVKAREQLEQVFTFFGVVRVAQRRCERGDEEPRGEYVGLIRPVEQGVYPAADRAVEASLRG